MAKFTGKICDDCSQTTDSVAQAVIAEGEEYQVLIRFDGPNARGQITLDLCEDHAMERMEREDVTPEDLDSIPGRKKRDDDKSATEPSPPAQIVDRAPAS